MVYRGRRCRARAALSEAGLVPDFPLSAKDASALDQRLHGVAWRLAVLALEDAKRNLKHADIAMTLSLECMRGEPPRSIRGCTRRGRMPGKRRPPQYPAHLRRIAGCSEAARVTIYPDEARAPGKPPAPRVQDVIPLRCTPQLHGPMRDALGYVGQVVGTEINSATDNPLMFDDGAGVTPASPVGISTGSTSRR